MAKKKNQCSLLLLIGIVLCAVAIALFAMPFIKMSLLGASSKSTGFAFSFGAFTLLGGDEAVAKAAFSGDLNGTLVTAYGVSSALTKISALLLFVTFIVMVLTAVLGLLNALGILKGTRLTALLAAVSVLLMLVAAILVFVLIGKIKKETGVSASTLIYIPFAVQLVACGVMAKALKK